MTLSETSLSLFVLPLDAPEGWEGTALSPTAELLELLAFLLAPGKGLARKHCRSPLPPVPEWYRYSLEVPAKPPVMPVSLDMDCKPTLGACTPSLCMELYQRDFTA